MKGWRFTTTAALILTATVVSGCAGTNTAKKKPETKKSPLLREVVMGDTFFEPKLITVPRRTPIRFQLNNEGELTHEFRVLIKTEPVREVPPKSKDVFELEFSRPGEYEYICTINNHDFYGMKGRLIVE